MALAQQGLPSGGSLGYELFDRSDSFGATSFVQNLNRTRALEGELARSIRTINGVTNSRVHLVLPRRGVFENQTQESSASIVLRLSRSLDREQVRAIQNLVAAAVPDPVHRPHLDRGRQGRAAGQRLRRRDQGIRLHRGDRCAQRL